MKNSQKGFIVPLIVVLVALLVIGGGYFYVQNKNLQIKLSQNEVVATTTPQVLVTPKDNIVTYNQPVFGVQFSIPEIIASEKTIFDYKGEYYQGEIIISELDIINMLPKIGNQVGWNANLFNNCTVNTDFSPYCFGIYMGVWTKAEDKIFPDSIPSLSNNNYQVSLSEKHEVVYDTLQGRGSPTHSGTYVLFNKTRNFYVYFGFLTAKNQMEPLSETQIKEEQDFYNNIKDVVLPKIIKTVSDTKTDVFLSKKVVPFP